MMKNILYVLKVATIIVVLFIAYNLKIRIVTDVDKSLVIPNYNYIEMHNFKIEKGVCIGYEDFEEGLYLLDVEFDTWWMERL